MAPIFLPRARVSRLQTARLFVWKRMPADANTGYRKDDALRVAAATYGLDYYYEQPCERYDDNLFVR